MLTRRTADSGRVARQGFIVPALGPGAVLIGALLSLTVEGHQQQTFRGRTTLVPVDVRVVSDDGAPVHDLGAKDFEVREDGVLQEIVHFAAIDFLAGSKGMANPGQSELAAASASLGSNRRVFLLVLGRGRLQGPARGLEAAERFIRHGLLPTDAIGVVAYDRATDVTQDREAILRLIDRYRAGHEAIEARLDHWFSGLIVLFGSGSTPPPGVQAQIDALFDAPGLPPLRKLVAFESAGLADDRRDLLARADAGQIASLEDSSHVVATQDDVSRLYAAVNYLRYIEGEKHLVFLSEDGLVGLGRSEYSDGFAAMAADARVTVSSLHVGGVSTGWSNGALRGPSWGHRFALLDARSMAEITGGISLAYRMAADGFDRLELSTRSGYLLGYYPPNRRLDGRFRRIEVTVRRPGVKALYRHGYYDRQTPPAGDRRQIMAHARITTAGASRLMLRDLGVSLNAGYTRRAAQGWQVKAEVVIDPTTLRFTAVNGRHMGKLNLAVFAGSADEDLVGETWKSIDLDLDETTFQRLKRESIAYEVLVDLKGPGGRIKAVVYDYLGDRVGTATREIR